MSYQPPVNTTRGTSSLATVSLVLGILSWLVLPFIGAIGAVICGHMARGEIRRSPPDAKLEGDGLAITGLVLGYLQMALWLLVILLVIGAMVLGLSSSHWH